MNEQLVKAIDELKVFLVKSKNLNVESRDLLESIASRDDDEFMDMNEKESVDVLDIVILYNCILANNCGS